MGTPAIAAACLEKLIAGGQEIAGVYTKPDTPKNRGMKMAVSEVKAAAQTAGIPVRQPVSFRGAEEAERLRALQPELIAVVAYGKLLPREILEIPPLGCVNIHASLLPALRGSAPVQWSILNGLSETGVTAMYMCEELDAGDRIGEKRIAIEPDETAGELMERLTPLAADLLLETVQQIAEGKAARTPQDPKLATYAPMLTKSMAPIDWNRNPREIVNHILGLNPWPVATTELTERRFRIHRAARTEKTTERPPGTPVALTKAGLEIACGGGGVVCVTQLQAEGGKRMSAPDYFRGHPIVIERR